MKITEDMPLEAERRVEITLDRLDITVDDYSATVDGLWKRPRLVSDPES